MNDGKLGSTVALAVSGIVLVLAGALMVWLARRSASGRLPRNQIAGVRTRLTLSSDEAWYPAQRAAAGGTAVGGWGAIVAGALVVALGLWQPGTDVTFVAAASLTLGGAAWMIVWVLVGASAAQRAARAAQDAP